MTTKPDFDKAIAENEKRWSTLRYVLVFFSSFVIFTLLGIAIGYMKDPQRVQNLDVKVEVGLVIAVSVTYVTWKNRQGNTE
jgi:hypothetical protein